MNGCKNHCGFDKGIELNSERKKTRINSDQRNDSEWTKNLEKQRRYNYRGGRSVFIMPGAEPVFFYAFIRLLQPCKSCVNGNNLQYLFCLYLDYM